MDGYNTIFREKIENNAFIIIPAVEVNIHAVFLFSCSTRLPKTKFKKQYPIYLGFLNLLQEFTNNQLFQNGKLGFLKVLQYNKLIQAFYTH